MVDENDHRVIGMNHEASFEILKIKDKRLDIAPEAAHLFEEPGKLEEVARALLASGLSGICLPDPCRTLALFMF
jgi:hypothetical protein